MGVAPQRRQPNNPLGQFLLVLFACQLEKNVIGVGALVRREQIFHVFDPSTIMGRFCRREVVDAFRVHVDLAAVVEQAHDFQRLLAAGVRKRPRRQSCPHLDGDVGIDALVAEQQVHHVIVLHPDGHVEGATESIARLVWVEPMVENAPQGAQASAQDGGGDKTWPVGEPGAAVDAPAQQEHVHHSHIPSPGGNQHRRCPVVDTDVDIGAQVQQRRGQIPLLFADGPREQAEVATLIVFRVAGVVQRISGPDVDVCAGRFSLGDDAVSHSVAHGVVKDGPHQCPWLSIFSLSIELIHGMFEELRKPTAALGKLPDICHIIQVGADGQDDFVGKIEKLHGEESRRYWKDDGKY